jgi:O-antigen biosynthesis protein
VTHVNPDPVDAVKSRLLPLAPREAAMERFIERFPRRWVTADLTPLKSIAVIDAGKGEYRSAGTDACFVLTLDGVGQEGGWFYVEAALVRHNGNRLACLKVETTDSSDRRFDWPITTNLRGSIREVIYLPPNLKRLLWHPTCAPGFFSQSPLRIHRISFFESVARRLHRVVVTIAGDKREPAILKKGLGVFRALGHLEHAYRQTAQLRADRVRGNNYQEFLARAEKLSRVEQRQMREQARTLADSRATPLISIFVVMVSPVAEYLCKMIDSITSQLYGKWELCLCADSSVSDEVAELLARRQAADPRIVLMTVPGDQSYSACLNHMLRSATGDYAVCVGQHDVVHAHALFHVSMELARCPRADLVYTDEDSVDALGVRSEPAFKPEWNPDLLLSQNYISQLAVMRTRLVLSAGGYQTGYDGSEHYDLLLRLSREVAPEAIRHIPKVLYSRRTQVGSDTTDASHLSGLRALQEHLRPTGATAISGPAVGVYRVCHALPAQAPLVTLIIPTRDKLEILKKCIAGIQFNTDYQNWEMLVIDNGSVDPETHAYFSKIIQDARIRVLAYDKPFNFSAINNFAANVARGDVLALLNNDLEVIAPHWLHEMVSHAIRPKIGAVGAKLLYPDGMVQHAGVVLGIGGVAGHVHRYLPGNEPGYCHRASVTQNLSAVTGACMVVRKALYWQVGGLNEASLAVAFNDIDFCLKLRDAGYRNLYTPHALLTHHESLSRGRDDTEEKNQIFRQEYAYMQNTWKDKLRDDPAYNVNLSLEFENFSFALPA